MTEMTQWRRDVNKVLARKRNGLQLCDLAGEDADMMEALEENGVPVDVVSNMLGGDGDE